MRITRPTEVRYTVGGTETIEANEFATLDYVVEPMLDFVNLNAKATANRRVVSSYDDIPAIALPSLRELGYVTGQMSVDVFEAPIVAQSWFVLDRIRQLAEEHGGQMSDVVKLVQYFRHLPHYAQYNRVRGLFYPGEPPVSTVVEVSRFLPADEALVEVEATMYLPR